MKHIAPFFLAAILLFSCPSLTPQPTDHDYDAIYTAAIETAMVIIHSEQTITAAALTEAPTFTQLPTSTPTPFPTPTPSLTPSPFPTEIESLLRDRCPMPWRSVFAVAISSYGYFERYGDKGCILPTFSANRKHLAYVTLDKPRDQSMYVDTVRIVATDSHTDRTIYFAHEQGIISNLEWSPTGQLVIWELIWEGPFFVLVYDPTLDSTVATMRLDYTGKLEWSPTGSAFYAVHSHDYGSGTCIHELKGYDFAHNQPFPNFYKILGVEEEETGLLGIPNGKSDDLAIDPFAWSADGTVLWITITPLRLLENGLYYEPGPRHAGQLEFTESGVIFTMLASDPDLDYSFEGFPVPRIVSSPYQPQRCP